MQLTYRDVVGETEKTVLWEFENGSDFVVGYSDPYFLWDTNTTNIAVGAYCNATGNAIVSRTLTRTKNNEYRNSTWLFEL